MILFLVTLLGVGAAENLLRTTKNVPMPGFELKLTQKGIDYVSDWAVDKISASINGKTLPDQSGKEHHVKYHVTHMTVTGFNKPKTSVAVNPGKGMTGYLSNAALSVKGHLHYKKHKFIKGQSSFKVSVSGISMTTKITLGISADGHLTLLSQACSSTVGHLSIKFHHGSARILNMFRHSMAKSIKDKLPKMICSSSREVTNEASKMLCDMKVRMPVKGTPIQFDFRLVAKPVFGKGYIQTQNKGEFFYGSDKTEAPFSPKAIYQAQTNGKMVTACFSDYVVNTLGYVLNKRGLAKMRITNKDLPVGKKGFLNTTCTKGQCIGKWVKQLGRKFPDSAVEIFMTTVSSPYLNTASNHIHVHFNTSISFLVRLANKAVTTGFITNMVGNVMVTGKMSSKRITGRVEDLSVHFKVTKTNVGPISDMYLNTLFRLAKRTAVLPGLNAIGKKGFALPNLPVHLQNPELYLLKDTICFGTDVTLKPHPI